MRTDEIGIPVQAGAMRWFTCTPVEFGGGPDFFARDSGLLCRGFQDIGVDSKAVMPGARKPDDESDLIRTNYANLESADWWQTHQLDGVVLYAWGRPRFRQVARAIRQAGIRLVLNQDSGGLVSARCGWRDWLAEQRILAGAGRVRGGWLRYAALVTRGLSLGLWVTDPLRAIHLRQGDWIAAVSPRAAEHYRKLCADYVGPDTAKRVVVVPHPVSPVFYYTGMEKRRRIVAIGRWGDERQKRTSLLTQVVADLLCRDARVEVDLIGTISEDLEAWHRQLEKSQRKRCTLHGRKPPSEIASLLNEAQVSYCPSAYESFHIASGEALCCGCSVVAGQSVSLSSFEWFVGDGDGQLATQDDASGHVRALRAELDAWTEGKREAKRIAQQWTERLSAPRVAERVLRVAHGHREPKS